jgi:transposase-like protein
MSTELKLRQRAVRLRLDEQTIESICDQLHRSQSWFRKWWRRYQSQGSDGLRDRSRAPKHHPRRLLAEIQAAIIKIRDRLVARRGPQARYRLAGAPTIRHELEVLGYQPVPSLREIERVLQQSNRTCPRFRLQPEASVNNYPAPVARASNQVHQMDLIGPRYLKGSRTRYYFLTYTDIYDKAIYVEFHRNPTAQTAMDFVVRAWQRLGLPYYLQVDNDRLFGGFGYWPGSIGRFIRLALRVGVQLVFIPEGEPFRNGVIEHFNGWLQERLLALRLHSVGQVRRELCALRQICWDEHIHPDLDYQTTAQIRRELAVRRLPADFAEHRTDLPISNGKVIFIRQVRRSGRISILKVRLLIGKRFRGQYVWAELSTRTRKLKVYLNSELIKELDYPLHGVG